MSEQEGQPENDWSDGPQLEDRAPEGETRTEEEGPNYWFLAGAGVVVLLVGFVCIGAPAAWWMLGSGEAASKNAEKRAVVRAEEPEAKKSASAAAAPAETVEAELGEEFELGRYAYRVERLERTGAVGDAGTAREAGTDSTFLVVTYRIRNNTSEKRTVSTGDVWLEDADGTSYQTSPKGRAALSGAKGLAFVTLTLPPKKAKNAGAVFRVPDEALEKPLTVVIPTEGASDPKRASKGRVIVKPGALQKR